MPGPASYDLCDSIFNGHWPHFTGWMVSGELRDSTNLINAWWRNLDQLAVWNLVLREYGEMEAWDIRIHLVEPLAHFCLLQPSATRDRVGLIATNAVHQANLALASGYQDVLDQDHKHRGQFLRRNEVEKQLGRIGVGWKSIKELAQALVELDGPEHRRTTFDFRNRVSHFIAPRLELGCVSNFSREIVPREKLVKRPDGRYQAEKCPEEKVVRYGWGELEPLTLNEIVEVNTAQYLLALQVHNCYSKLLTEILDRMQQN